MDDKEIATKMLELFNGKVINQREIFALQIMNDQIVVKITVDRIESIDAKNNSTYG